jgi:hypothetical protein
MIELVAGFVGFPLVSIVAVLNMLTPKLVNSSKKKPAVCRHITI